MSDDIEDFMSKTANAGRECEPVQMLSWGALTRLTLRSGPKIGVYQPRHETPNADPSLPPRRQRGAQP